MRWRAWRLLIAVVSLAAITATWLALPELVRRVAISRIQALTHRQVTIDRVDLHLSSGRLAVRGLRIAERGADVPFADFERLDVRLHLPSLVRGHLRIREAVLQGPTVRVVRLPTDEFNFSDLIRASGEGSGVLDITVDRFVLERGTVTLEDRALPETRTWTTEHITIEARNISTRRDDGSAEGSSLTAGAPVSLRIERLRLYPIHLQASLVVEGLDLAMARLYLPPDAPVMVERGRLNTLLHVVFDAHEGLKVDATGSLEDLALVRPGESVPLALVPRLTARVSGLDLKDERLRLGRLEVTGSGSVPDVRGKPGTRLDVPTFRARVEDLTWPAIGPARLELLARTGDGAQLAASGILRAPSDPSALRLRLSGLALEPWARLLTPVRIRGVAEADLEVNEPISPGVLTRVRGSVAVKNAEVADDAHQPLAGARVVRATGLQVHWPGRLAVQQVLIDRPWAKVERDRTGGFPLMSLWRRPAAVSAAAASPAPAPAASVAVEVEALAVRGGTVAWQDAAVTPPARFDIAGIDAMVTGVSWPLRGGPAGVRVSLRPPRGGRLALEGRVTVDPPAADLRVSAKDADLVPYQPYLPTHARVGGWADLDLAVAVPVAGVGRPTVRGSATLSRVDVRDGERTVMRVDRATATGIDVEWPRRIVLGRLALEGPWILVERDETGALPLPALLMPTNGVARRGGTSSASADAAGQAPEAPAVTVERLDVAGGGIRAVDRSVSPAFAVDVRRLALRMDGLSTGPAPLARVDLHGEIGRAAAIELRGTVGSLGAPLRLDVSGELRRFTVPSANPYILRTVAWRATQGSLTTGIQCRIEGSELDARASIRLSQLQLVRDGGADEAQTRIGLPLGMLVSLMKDARGNIDLAIPVSGRVNDPRFDFHEAVWGAVRTVVVNAITLPVSWIGRVRLGSNSQIEEIQVDPISFQPGTPIPTPEGQSQLKRLVDFLEQLPEVRMTLAAVVTARDLEEIRRQTIEATIDHLARQASIPQKAAAARLFRQFVPDRQPPDTLDATIAALLQREPALPGEVAGLASRRLEAVRAVTTQAGIAPDRLLRAGDVQQRTIGDGTVELVLVPPQGPRQSLVHDFLRRLGITEREPGYVEN